MKKRYSSKGQYVKILERGSRKMREKRIVLVNDVTGLSRCSVACQLPIISSMGIETAFVPTAILSINTYHKDFFFDDYYIKGERITLKHIKKDIDF